MSINKVPLPEKKYETQNNQTKPALSIKKP